MPTSFALTLDSTHNSLVLVAGETILDDVTSITIHRTADGFDCEVTRAAGGDPVRLVAAASPAGRQALSRATGQMSPSAPGFVEMTAPNATTACSLTDGIAQCFGWKQSVDGG